MRDVDSMLEERLATRAGTVLAAKYAASWLRDRYAEGGRYSDPALGRIVKVLEAVVRHFPHSEAAPGPWPHGDGEYEIGKSGPGLQLIQGGTGATPGMGERRTEEALEAEGLIIDRGDLIWGPFIPDGIIRILDGAGSVVGQGRTLEEAVGDLPADVRRRVGP